MSMPLVYVAVTDPKWYQFQKDRKREKVVFCRKSARPVNLSPGDYFFFLIRGPLPRSIMGYGVVEKVNSLPLGRIWSDYRNLVGYNCLKDMVFDLKKKENDPVGFYFLNKLKYSESEIAFDNEINFSINIMAGKTLGEDDIETLRNRI